MPTLEEEKRALSQRVHEERAQEAEGGTSTGSNPVLISDTDESPVYKYQSDICEPVLPKATEKICPTCVPDPTYNPPLWRVENKATPFLNEALCEYQIPVILNEEGDVYTARTIIDLEDKMAKLRLALEKNGVKGLESIAEIQPLVLRDILFRSYVLPGIRLLLRHYNKLETDDIVCTFPAIRVNNAEDSMTSREQNSLAGATAGATTGAVIGAGIGGLLGAGIGAAVGGIGGALLGTGDGHGDDSLAAVTDLSARCLTVFQMLKAGLISEEFASQLTQTFEVPTADGGTMELPKPNPQFLLAIARLMESKNDSGEPLFPHHDINTEGLELYARVAEYDLGQSPADPIRVLVSVPAYIFDAIPEAPEPEVNNFEGAKKVELPVLRFSPMIKRLSRALSTYGKYQAYWWQTERATLYKTRRREDGEYTIETPDDYMTSLPQLGGSEKGGQVGSGIHDFNGDEWGDDGDQSIFYIFNYASAISKFYDATKDLLAANDFVLTSVNMSMFGLRDIPDEIRFVFDEDEDGLFMIKAVWVKTQHCGWERLKKGMPSFLDTPAVQDRTVVGYIAFLNDIDTALIAKETPPWLDFITQYTYPPLMVKYESDSLGPPGKEDPISCVLEGQGQALRDYIFDELMTLGDAIAYQFNKNACKLITNEDKKDKNQYQPYELFQKGTGKSPSGLKGAFDKDNWAFPDPVDEYAGKTERDKSWSDANTASTLELEAEIRAEGQSLKREDFNNQADYDAAVASNARRLDNTTLDSEGNPIPSNDTIGYDMDDIRAANKSHPFESLVMANALEEFDLNSSLLGFFVDDMELRAKPTKPWKAFSNPFGRGMKSKFVKTMSRLDLCGLTAMGLKAIQCLMGGTTLDAAWTAVIRAALESMDDANWDKLFLGLPYDKQLEISALISKQFGDLPPPWKWKAVATDSKKLDKKIIEGTASSAEQKKYDDAKNNLDNKIKKFDDIIDSGGIPDEAGKKGITAAQAAKSKAELERKREKLLTDEKYNVKYTEAQEGGAWPNGTDREFDLTQGDIAAIKDRISEYQRATGGDPNNLSKGTTDIGKALGPINKAIYEAYIDAILELVNYDILLSYLDTLPGAKMIINMIGRFDCPYPGLIHPPLDSFMASLSLDVCGDNRGSLRVPNLQLNKFGDLSFMNLIKVLAEILYRQFWKLLTKIMVKLVVKILQILESAICKAIEAAGRLAAAAVTPGDQGGFMGAIVDTFCGDDASDEEQEKMAADLLASLGVDPKTLKGSASDYEGSHKPLINTMNALSTKNEYKRLLVSSPMDMDTGLLDRISRAVTNLHPEWAPIFRDPDSIAQMFAAAGNLLSPGQRQALKGDLDNPMDDIPIEDTMCLTNSELEKWNRDRIELFSNSGVPTEIAEQWVEDQNKKVESDLVEMCSIAARGINEPLKDAIDDLLDPENSTKCNSESRGLQFTTDELDKLDEDQAKGVWKSLGSNFQKDLIGGGWFGNKYGAIDHILSDRTGTPLRKHESRTRMSWMFPNWNNSQEDHDKKIQLLKERRNDTWVDLWTAEDVTSPFPLTVGITLHNQLVTQASSFSMDITREVIQSNTAEYIYKVKGGNGENVDVLYQVSKPPRLSPDFVFEFLNNTTRWGYGFDLEYSSYSVNNNATATEDFSYHMSTKIKTNKTQARLVSDPNAGVEDDSKSVNYWIKYDTTVNPSIKPEVNTLLASYNLDTSVLDRLNYQGLSFYGMVENAWKKANVELSDLPTNLGREDSLWGGVYFNIITKEMYEKTLTMIMRPEDPKNINPDYIPRSYDFGYSSDSKITFKDLLYVNPGASDDEGTWFYDYPEEAKVLGKSATNNPRVHFLDPAVHGGWYNFPKIYVEPYDHDGIMKIVQMMVPEIDGCQPKKTDFLDTNNLADIVKKVTSKTPPDKRLSYNEECVYKRPFDLIVPPKIHGYIEATVVATIRLYISDYILRSMPAFGALEFNKENYDDFIANIIYENMKKDMMDRNPWFGGYIFIKKHVYWYIFLEQVAQITKRRYDDSEDEIFGENEEYKHALKRINKAKQNFANITDKRVDHLIQLTEKVYSFNGLGYSWDDEEYKKLSNEDKKIMRSTLPATSPISPNAPWYRQIQHGLGLIEYGPDYKNWKALMASKTSAGGGWAAGSAVASTTAAAATPIANLAMSSGAVTSNTAVANLVFGSTVLGASALIAAPILVAGAILVNLHSRDGKSRFSTSLGPYTNWDWKPNLVGSKWYKGIYKKAAKIYSIASVEDECIRLLKVMINEQLDFYSKKLRKEGAIKPEITNLSKFFIGGGNGIMFSNNLNSGKRKAEVPLVGTNNQGSTVMSYEESMGDVSDVQQSTAHYHYDPNYNSEVGGFFIQKYIRLVDKAELGDDDTDVPKWVKERPERCRGVVGIKTFTDWVNLVKDANSDGGLHWQWNQDAYLSELFGNLEALEVESSDTETEDTDMLLGTTIGFRFGVRLMYKPPSTWGSHLPPPSEEQIEFSKTEKAFYYSDPAEPFMGKSYIFPLASFEKDVIDKKIGSIDFDNDSFLGEDLRCYIDNLCETPEFKLLFENIFPIRRCSSLVSSYVYNGWFASIGGDESERDVVDPDFDDDEPWQDRIFEDTQNVLYKMFKSYYNTDSWDWEWDWD